MHNLLQSRRFYPLLITQFLGALNDNLFKNALLTLVALKMTDQSDILSNLIAGLFILPFFLFSAWAGEFADKYPRDKIARLLKLVEIVLMIGVAIAYNLGSLPLLIVTMTLMGTQSAFFGPVKYALLPQQLKAEELITGNAYVEATTYLAILFGLILGTLLPIEASIALLIVLAVCGYAASCRILPAPAPRPQMQMNKNLFAAVWYNYKFLKKHRYILQSILGASWFWMIGALVAVQIYPLCGQVLNAGEGVITFFLVLFSCGVAAGSYTCNRLLKGNIDTTYVPLSAVGMALSLISLWLFTADYPTPEKMLSLMEFLSMPRALGLSSCLFVLAFWGGLYIIPLNAFMQNRAPKAFTASVIAGNNIFNSLGMVGVAVFAIVLFKLGFDLPQLFLTMGLISLLVAVYICVLLPDSLTRSLLQTLLKFMFRTEVKGRSYFYKAGKRVLIIANHTSLWDGILLAAFMPERITFAITSAWTQKWFMPLIRVLVDFYPVDPANPLSIRSLIEEIKKGRKVMIFPEGRISLTGKMMQVYDGAAMIAAKAGARLLPIRIEGAQYSKLSYVKDKFRTRWFPKINLHILQARKFEVPLSKNGRNLAARKLYEMMSEMMYQTSTASKSFYQAVRDSSVIHGQKHIVAVDLAGHKLSYGRLLKRSAVLGETLRQRLQNVPCVGLLLPTGIDFLLMFTALQYLGKDVVLLSADGLDEQIRQSGAGAVIGLKSVKTSAPLIVYEEIRPQLKDWLVWKKAAENECCISVFKNGKMLQVSMRQLLENSYQLDCVLPFNAQDTAVNSLPAENADGLVLGTILPLLSGVKTCFYAGKHKKILPKLCYDLAARIIFASAETFEICAQEAAGFDFFNIRMAFAVGDKLNEQLLESWLKNYGIRILENWTPENGVTVAAVNTPLYNRFGSLGCLLPCCKADEQHVRMDDDGFIWL